MCAKSKHTDQYFFAGSSEYYHGPQQYISMICFYWDHVVAIDMLGLTIMIVALKSGLACPNNISLFVYIIATYEASIKVNTEANYVFANWAI